MVSACVSQKSRHVEEVTGHLPDLNFSLTSDGRQSVTAKTYEGNILLLYFGFPAKRGEDAVGMPQPCFIARASRSEVAPSEGTAPPRVAPFRLVAPCSARPEPHTPPPSTTGFRMKGCADIKNKELGRVCKINNEKNAFSRRIPDKRGETSIKKRNESTQGGHNVGQPGIDRGIGYDYY